MCNLIRSYKSQTNDEDEDDDYGDHDRTRVAVVVLCSIRVSAIMINFGSLAPAPGRTCASTFAARRPPVRFGTGANDLHDFLSVKLFQPDLILGSKHNSPCHLMETANDFSAAVVVAVETGKRNTHGSCIVRHVFLSGFRNSRNPRWNGGTMRYVE